MYVYNDAAVHSVPLSALSSQQVFFGRDMVQINRQALAWDWRWIMTQMWFVSVKPNLNHDTVRPWPKVNVGQGFLQKSISSLSLWKLVEDKRRQPKTVLDQWRCSCRKALSFPKHQTYVTWRQITPKGAKAPPPHTVWLLVGYSYRGCLFKVAYASDCKDMVRNVCPTGTPLLAWQHL